jgi:electron transfer flavoprotein beta subunit
MGYTQLTYVTEIMGIENDTITVRREIEGGCEVIQGRLPAMLTVEMELASIRYATLPELIRALRHEVKVWGARDINAAPEKLGLKGSPTSVREIFAPPVRGGGISFDAKEKKEKAVENFLEALFTEEQTLMEEVLNKASYAQE